MKHDGTYPHITMYIEKLHGLDVNYASTKRDRYCKDFLYSECWSCLDPRCSELILNCLVEHAQCRIRLIHLCFRSGSNEICTELFRLLTRVLFYPYPLH